MGSEVSVEGDTTDGSADELEQQRPTHTTRTHLLCLARAHNRFSVELYQEYAREGKRPGNFVMAPIGVSLALGLLHIGAKGPTRDEIHRVLHLHEVTSEQLLPAFAAMHWDVLRSTFPKGCIFEVALRLFAQSQIYLAPHYEDLCTNFEISRLKQADFRVRPDKARLEINQWAEERTNHRVKDVIPMGIIDRDTKILGLSSIYMKTLWLHPFDPKKTCNELFMLPMKETLNVRMMVQHRMYRHAQNTKLDCEVVELPFANSFNRLLVLLPKKPEGIQKLEHKLDRKTLESIYDSLQDDYLEVHIPKFRYELGLTLGDMLQKLGMKTMFAPSKADFSNINGSHDLHVSRIFHHVYLEVDEGVPTGSNSAHSSHKASHHHHHHHNHHPQHQQQQQQQQQGPDGAHTSQELDKKVFRCHHPFMFVIRDDRTGVVSFLGRVVRPLQAT